jgi:hypothetical protein
VISLILPYWDRQAAADKALALIAKNYADMPLQVVVIDDGNAEPFRLPQLPLSLICKRLPKKDEPKSPVTCWNEGVALAQGDIIVLSCIEVLHEEPVLAQMAAELERMGPDGYVLAAAWCPELSEWHCHSRGRSEYAPELPGGFGRAFCGMMHRSLYEAAGGFDEDYRDGAGYEDIDFAYRMIHAGAKVKIRDDLVVIHPKSGAKTRWRAEQFAINEALLRGKWGC